MKILLTGSPHAGKSTLSEMFLSERWHTDSLLPCEWSMQSEQVSEWFDRTDWTCIEGTAIPRALRKWLSRSPGGKPCDLLIWLQPIQELTTGQLSMARGELTVLKEILPELYKRKVRFLWELPEESWEGFVDKTSNV